MKKDKSIKKHLDLYADSFEKKEELLCDAYAEMDRRREDGFYAAREKELKSAKRGRMWVGAMLSCAAALLLIFVTVSLFPFFDSAAPPTSLSYSFSELTRVEKSREELNGTNGIRFLNQSENTDETFYAYYKNGESEIYAIEARYKTQRDLSVDKIIVVTDLKGGLKDYDKDSNFNKQSDVGRNYDRYKDGEYYSYLYYSLKTTKHYISVMSPNSGGGTVYEKLLFD